ncbi:hypothetical protein [Nocardia sp. NBC_01388]|uniref:hypothetical protein n=1 Tax=Nocardia sp. NBC_01388 TaxID=2903596 RepID=UPI0032530E23
MDHMVLRMDDLDRWTAVRVETAMTRAGVCSDDLAAQIRLTRAELAGRLAATSSFEIGELIRIAAALNRDVVDLLPTRDCIDLRLPHGENSAPGKVALLEIISSDPAIEIDHHERPDFEVAGCVLSVRTGNRGII